MENVQGLPPHQQQQFMTYLEQMQMKDSLTWVLSICILVLRNGLVNGRQYLFSNRMPFVLTILCEQNVQQSSCSLFWFLCVFISLKVAGQQRNQMHGKLRFEIHQDGAASGIKIPRAPSIAATAAAAEVKNTGCNSSVKFSGSARSFQ